MSHHDPDQTRSAFLETVLARHRGGSTACPLPQSSMSARFFARLALLVLVAAASLPASAQNLSLFRSFEGRVAYTGGAATFRTNSNAVNACSVGATSAITIAGIPAGATIEGAYVYWTGSGPTPDYNVTLDTAPITAERQFTQTFEPTGRDLRFFQGVRDITAQVSAKRNAEYTLGGLTVTNTNLGNVAGRYCATETVSKAWAIHVIYSDPTRVRRSRVNLYDGFRLSLNETQTNSISDFETPGASQSGLTTVVWEGDAGQGTGEVVDFSTPLNGSLALDSSDPFNSIFRQFNGTEAPTVFGVDYDIYNISSVATGTTTGTLTLTAATNDLVILSSAVLAMQSLASDVAVTISASDTTPAVGDNTAITVVATNNGPDRTDVATVDVPIPAGYTLVAQNAPAGTTFNASTGRWTIPGGLAVNASQTLTFTLRADADPAVTLTATVNAPDRVEANQTNNVASVGIDAVPPTTATVGILKTVDTGQADVGDEVTFTITVTNPTNRNNDNVVVNDLLPAGFAHVSSTPTQGTYNEINGNWSVGRVDRNGGTETLTIVAQATAAGTLVNTAQITAASEPDADASNNSSSATVTVRPPLTPAPGLCYAVADNGGANGGNDWLIALTRSMSQTTAVGTGTGTNEIEAVAHYPDLPPGTLYGANAGTFGTLDLNTGVFSPIGAFGTGTGIDGEVAFTDADGLTFDPLTGRLFASHRREGTPNLEDVLFVVDPATGAFVPDAFGLGIDYVVIATSAPVSQLDIDDIAISPINGQLYGIANGSSADQLVRIDKLTGAVTLVGALGEADVEGLAFAANGTLYGTTGTGGGARSDSFFSIDTDSGASTFVGAFSRGSDFESVACLTDGLNTVAGTVFYDTDRDASYDGTPTDTPEAGQTVSLYRDVDGSGTVTAGDVLVATTTTDANGAFAFTVAAEGDFAVEATNLLDGGGGYTTAESLGASFTGYGTTAGGRDIGYTTEADLRLEVSVDEDAPEIGDTVTFTVEVTNDGPIASSGFTATGALTGDLTYTGFQSTDATFDSGTGLFTVGPLAPGATATATITATVSGPASGTLTSQIQTANEPDTDSTPGNSVATEDDQDAATVTPVVPDLELSVEVDNAAPALGTDVMFTITLDNASAVAQATGVDVAGLLPAGYSLVSTSTATGSYNPVSETWSVGTIGPNGQAVLTITATATTTDASTFAPEVSAQDQPDLDSTPGDATGDDFASVNVQAFPPDLALAISVDDDAPGIGDTVTYTIDLTSENAADATGIDISALLPAGVEFASAAPSQGTYNATTGTWDVGAVAGNGSAQLVIEAVVQSLGTQTLAAEVAAMDQPDADSTPGNGSTTEDDDASVSITPQPIDLELALSVSDATAPLGTDVTFTLDLTNASAVNATGVSVAAELPAGYTFVSSTPSATYNSAIGLWTIGGLAANSTTRLELVATVASATPGTLTAEVDTADQPDLDSTPSNSEAGEDDQASAGVTPGLPDLQVSTSVSDSAPALGTDVTFTVTLDNVGPAGATGVDLAALLPAGYTLVSADPSQGSYAGGVWTVGSIGATGQVTLTLVATATTPAASTFAPEVTAQDQPDADSTPNDGTGDDFATVAVQAFAPDLALAVSASTATPVLGQPMTLTVDLTSENAADATGVDVSAAIPAGFELVSSAPSQGSYNVTTGTWSVGAVDGNATAQLVLTVRPVAEGATAFAAEVATMDQPDGDSTPGNNSTTEDDDDSVALTAQTIDLELAISVDDPTPVLGQQVTFTVDLDNMGAADATGVSVDVPLPAGYTFVSVPPGTSYNAATGVWTVGALAASGQTTLEITATVDAPTPGDVTAEVGAADQPDTDSTPGNGVPTEDDQASQSVAVGYADLALDVSASDTSPAAGQQVTLTVDLTNDGTLDATGVTANAAIPTGYTLVSATPSQGSFDPNTGAWTVGGVAIGATPQLVLVARAIAGTATFEGEITAQNEPDADSTPGNDDNTEDDQDSVTLTGQPIDLSVAVAVSDASPDFGEGVTFTVTLTNGGPATATGTQVLAPLPAGYRYVLAGPAGAGSYDDATGIWTPGPLAAGESIELTIAAVAETLDASTFTAEVTAADQDDSDSTPGDGVGDDIASTSVRAQPIDLSLTASVDNATPALGDDVTFTLALANAGPADATNVVVTAPLPAGYTYVSATPGVTYDPATGSWTIPGVAAGSQIDLTVTATATTTDPVTLAAEVTAADQPDTDSAPGDGAGDDFATVGVAAQPTDLALAISVDDDAPAIGDDVTFTITLDNESATGATGVDVAALLPAGLSFVSADPSQGSYDASTGAWAVGAVGPNGQATLDITATVTASGSQTVTAEITATDQPDLDSTPGNSDAAEDDQASVSVSGQPTDLALTVSVDDSAPDFGQDVTFTVTLDNESVVDASGIAVDAVLPAGYAFVSADPAQGTYNSSTGAWSVGALAGSGQTTLTITATAQTLDASTFSAQVATGSPTDGDSTPGNSVATEDDQDAVALQAQPIDLSLTASVSDPAPALGDNVTFTFSLTNDGPADATGVTVSAPLPAGYTFVSSTPGLSYNATTGEWTIPSLPSGQTLDIEIVATATTTDPVTLAAEVTAADQPDADSMPGDGTGDDFATIGVAAQPTDLAVSIAASDAAPAIGDDVTFTITLDNESATGATGVDVAALLPAGLSFVSADPSQGSYDASTGAWAVGAVGANGQATLTVTATVTASGSQTVTAEITATDQPDLDSTPGNNDATEDDQASASISGQPTDLALAVSVDNDAPAFGDDVTFTVTLDNESGTAATGVSINAALPAGYTLVSATPAQGTYDPASGTWTVGTLAGTGQTTLTLVATAATADPAVFGAEVVTASPDDLDSTPGNADATEDDQDEVALQAVRTDLALALVASNDSPGIGEETTLTLTLTNESAVDASGIIARLPIPVGYTVVSTSADQGSYDPNTGTWSAGALAGNDQTTLTVVLRADVLTPASVTAEITAQDQPDIDSTPGNGAEAEDDQQTITLAAQPIDLALSASVDDSSPALGQTVTYTIVLDNESAVGATGVAVDAGIPAGITVTSTSASAGSYDPASGTWTVGALGANGQATLTITGTVDDMAPGDLTAQVSAADQPDLDSTPGNGVATEDDQATVALAVQAIDLELALSVDNAAPAPGDDVTFTVTLDNVLATTATGVTVSAPLPAGYTFVSSTPGASYDAATGVWTVGSLPTGTTTLDIVATVAGSDPGTLTAEVATADQIDIDSTPGNGAFVEDDQANVTVTPQVVDLALAMSIDEPLPNAGDVVTFVVTVTNEGLVDATGVQVSDRLIDQPGVAEIVSVTPSVGTFDGSLWEVGDLAAGESQTLTVEVRLVSDNVAFTNLAEIAQADQPDEDSVPYNGSTFEDDYAEATATTGGSSSGGEGGLESNGSLAEAIGSVLFARRAETGALADAGIELEPVTLDLARSFGASIRRYIPASGPRGATAIEVSPTDLLPVTNANEIVAADYLRGDGRRAGVVFGSATSAGEIYEHTKPVCDRLRGARLDAVSLIDVAGHPFVMTRLVQHDGSVDYAVSFIAYGTAASRTIDSRFLLGEYDAPASGDDVLNLQVWSPSRDHTASLVADVIAKLADDGDLDFRNTWEPRTPDVVLLMAEGSKRSVAGTTPALPTVFVRSAEYAEGRIRLDLYNAGGATSLRLSGGTLARAEGGGRSDFSRTLEIAPGTAAEPIVPVTIDTGYLFDAAFFVETDLTPEPDRLYLADGTWGVALDRSSETTRLANFAVRPQPEVGPLDGQRLIERPVHATGTVSTYATVYRTLRAGALPLDLSDYRYVEFMAAGDGEVQVLLQKLSIASADQFGATVTLTPEPKLHRIWFEDLYLADGSRGFTGEDAVAISLTRRSDGTPQPLDIAVSGLRFGGAQGDETALPEEPSLWPAMPNPFLGSTRLRYELPQAQHVTVRVFDVLGREVARLADGEHEAGRHTLAFDGRGLSAGIYIVRMELADRAFTRQMTLVR